MIWRHISNVKAVARTDPSLHFTCCNDMQNFVLVFITLWVFNNLILQLVMANANDIDSRWQLVKLNPHHPTVHSYYSFDEQVLSYPTTRFAHSFADYSFFATWTAIFLVSQISGVQEHSNLFSARFKFWNASINRNSKSENHSRQRITVVLPRFGGF